MRKVRIVPFESSCRDRYRVFATRSFGTGSYQANPAYLKWLYEENPLGGGDRASLAVAENGEVVGCVHKMRLLWQFGDDTAPVVAPHNLMVSEEHRNGLGFMILRSAVAGESHVLIPGVTEPLAEIYRKMRYHQLQTRWYRRWLAPAAAAFWFASGRLVDRGARPRYLTNPNGTRAGEFQVTVAPERELLRSTAEALNRDHATAAAPWWTEETVHWRFFHPLGPRHALLYRREGDRITELVILSLGPRRGLNVARVVAQAAESMQRLCDLLRAAERFAKQHGAHLLLTFTTDDDTGRAMAQAGWKEYSHPARSYIHHKGRPACDSYAVTGAAGDFGFESIPPESALVTT